MHSAEEIKQCVDIFKSIVKDRFSGLDIEREVVSYIDLICDVLAVDPLATPPSPIANGLLCPITKSKCPIWDAYNNK